MEKNTIIFYQQTINKNVHYKMHMMAIDIIYSHLIMFNNYSKKFLNFN